MTAPPEALSRALSAIHEAAATPARWSGALAQLGRLLGVEKAALLDIDSASRTVTGLVALGHDPEIQRRYVEYYARIDPTFALAFDAPPHRALIFYEHFPAGFRAGNEYFAFAREADIGDSIAATTQDCGGGRTALSFQRAYGSEPFEPAFKATLELLIPHVEIAKRMQARLADATRCASALAAGLDRFTVPAFIVRPGAAIVHLNEAARALLGSSTWLRLTGGRLGANEPRFSALFGEAIRRALSPAPAASILGARTEVGRPVEVGVAPLRPDHYLAAPWEVPLALVTVSETRLDGEAVARRMRLLYGLTGAEARVVADLAAGRTLEEIASGYGVRPSTVRSQLRSVFAKTGATRQAELVRLALAGAPLRPD